MSEEMKVSSELESRARSFCSTLGVNADANWRLVAAGLSAIGEVFRTDPCGIERNAVFYRDLKVSLLREVDGEEIVLGIEGKLGRFIDPQDALELMKIYRVSVAEWLSRLVKAKWVAYPGPRKAK
jgi:hypothetical protein